MKFVIFSDIHGNALALKECIKEIEKMEVDAIIWCGDYITDFPESHEVIQMIKLYSNGFRSYIISGNREQNVIEYANGKKYNIRQKNNIEYTYKLLTKEDIKWIESLPETLEIELDNNKKIFVSHKCTYENIEDCQYKIFGHSHKQCNFIRNGVKYINPGSVGIPTDENVGAQFDILEITENYEKVEQYVIKYNIEKAIKKLQHSAIYNDEVRWEKLLERELRTGIDYPQKCIVEYDKIRDEHHLTEESLEVWNIAVKNVLKQ